MSVVNSVLHTVDYLLTSDELGLLKAFEIPGGEWAKARLVKTCGTPDKSQAVTCLAASTPSTGARLIAVARKPGSIHVLDAASLDSLSTISPPTQQKKNDDNPLLVCGVAFLPTSLQESSGCTHRLLSVLNNGLVAVYNSTDDGKSWAQADTFTTCPHVDSMALDPGCTHLAVGGEGHQLRVYSLASHECVFQAKGGKPNRVGLVDLPHVSAITFLPHSSPPAQGDAPEGPALRLLVGTAQHKLWLYDTQAGKRPQVEVSWGEARIMALAAQPDGQKVWVANAAGGIAAYDVSAQAVLGSLKGAAGSVRALQLHPALPAVASVGLDRFLRVHASDSRVSLCKLYCKQHLTGVAWLTGMPGVPVVPSENSVERAQKMPAATKRTKAQKDGRTVKKKKV